MYVLQQPDLSNVPQDVTSFKDLLVQFANLSKFDKQDTVKPSPEVTVHPISNSQQPTSSLLHGILTKVNNITDRN